MIKTVYCISDGTSTVCDIWITYSFLKLGVSVNVVLLTQVSRLPVRDLKINDIMLHSTKQHYYSIHSLFIV